MNGVFSLWFRDTATNRQASRNSYVRILTPVNVSCARFAPAWPGSVESPGQHVLSLFHNVTSFGRWTTARQVDLVRDVFEGCPRGGSDEPSPVEVPSHYDVRAAVMSDSEATSSSMVVEVKQVNMNGPKEGASGFE